MPAALDPAFSSLDATVLAAFGETCTYLPKAGGATTGSGAVNEGSRIEETENGQVLIASLDVLVSRDFISDPQVGDQFKRESDDRTFSFAGLIADKGPGGWELRFERRQPYQIGGNRRP